MGLGQIELSGLFISEMSKNFISGHFTFLLQVGRVYVCGLGAFTKEAYLRAARNTFVFPGMQQERACGDGNGEGGREGGGGGGGKGTEVGMERTGREGEG